MSSLGCTPKTSASFLKVLISVLPRVSILQSPGTVIPAILAADSRVRHALDSLMRCIFAPSTFTPIGIRHPRL
jgi:hypothetical protein